MRPVKRAIILCWIMLVACFAIKLFGGNWFEVVCTNEHFIKVCDFIDYQPFVHQLFSYAIYVIPTLFWLLAISFVPKPNKKQLIYCLVGLIIVLSFKFIHIQVKSILEFAFVCISPIIINMMNGNKSSKAQTFKKTWYYGILGSVGTIAFQALSLFTRNIGIKIVQEKLFITFILLVDYYIMIALCYLYVKLKKGECQNG